MESPVGRPNSSWLAQLGDLMKERSMGSGDCLELAESMEQKSERGEVPSRCVLPYLT